MSLTTLQNTLRCTSHINPGLIKNPIYSIPVVDTLDGDIRLLLEYYENAPFWNKLIYYIHEYDKENNAEKNEQGELTRLHTYLKKNVPIPTTLRSTYTNHESVLTQNVIDAIRHSISQAHQGAGGFHEATIPELMSLGKDDIRTIIEGSFDTGNIHGTQCQAETIQDIYTIMRVLGCYDILNTPRIDIVDCKSIDGIVEKLYSGLQEDNGKIRAQSAMLLKLIVRWVPFFYEIEDYRKKAKEEQAHFQKWIDKETEKQDGNLTYNNITKEYYFEGKVRFTMNSRVKDTHSILIKTSGNHRYSHIAQLEDLCGTEYSIKNRSECSPEDLDRLLDFLGSYNRTDRATIEKKDKGLIRENDNLQKKNATNYTDAKIVFFAGGSGERSIGMEHKLVDASKDDPNYDPISLAHRDIYTLKKVIEFGLMGHDILTPIQILALESYIVRSSTGKKDKKGYQKTELGTTDVFGELYDKLLLEIKIGEIVAYVSNASRLLLESRVERVVDHSRQHIINIVHDKRKLLKGLQGKNYAQSIEYSMREIMANYTGRAKPKTKKRPKKTA